MIAVITTNVASEADALKLGKALLDNKLIVCSSITETQSQYFWKGNFHEEREFQLTVKTSLERKQAAIKYLNQHHPYDIPMIKSTHWEVNNAYKSWMDETLS